jgi:CHAT domain-containing protein
MSLRRLAMVYGSSGEAAKGLECYERLVQSKQHFAEDLFSYASEDQKMRYMEKYPLLDDSFISFALMVDSDDSKRCALEMVLRGKAAVVDAVSFERQIVFCAYDDKIQKQAQRHAEVCGEISALTLAGVGELDPEVYHDRMITLYGRKDSLETALSAGCAEFRGELSARRFTAADVAGLLPEGAVLWEFLRYQPYDFNAVGSDVERTGSPRYVAFTLDHEGNSELVDLGNAGEIDNLVDLFRQQIRAAGSEVYSPLAADSERRLSLVTGELYDRLFAPLVPSLQGGTEIFVSPDGQLCLIPFEILPCPGGEYVIEEFSVSYLSSGRDLLRYSRRRESSDWALLIADPDFGLSEELLARHRDDALEILSLAYEPFRGISECFTADFDPLPASRYEAESVADRLERMTDIRTKTCYGAGAVEEVLKAIRVAPRILHISTHGFFCEDADMSGSTTIENPLLRSGLALAGANQVTAGNDTRAEQVEDGILTAFEASSLNLVGTELVVLSACESGVGSVKIGEGVYGLRRSFQCAGAETIVMSLWEIPDRETRELMDVFYDRWLAGLSKKEALRESALEILRTARSMNGATHPLFWGGFVMVGDPN